MTPKPASRKVYEKVGKSITYKGIEWPPIIRDNGASDAFIQRIVDALNHYEACTKRERGE